MGQMISKPANRFDGDAVAFEKRGCFGAKPPNTLADGFEITFDDHKSIVVFSESADIFKRSNNALALVKIVQNFF